MSEEGQNRRVPDGEPVEDDPKASSVDDEASAVGERSDEQAEEVPAEVLDVTEEPEGDPEETPIVVPEAEDEPEPRAEPSPQEELLALVAELEEVRRERDEYLDDMRRMKAEMENSRRRLERDRARLSQLASEKLVRELLPVLDNLERALEVEGDIRAGVSATHGGLLAALGREGLEPVHSNGESFDPSVHEAVMGQPSEEHEEDTVIQTLERGYTMNGRTIRAAKVIVAKQV